MRRQTFVLPVALLVGASGSIVAQASKAQAPATVEVCKLLPKAEVKKHIPWLDVLDNMPIEEEPIGRGASSCNYPSVTVQVMSFSQGTVDALAKTAKLETIAGVGDAAYFRNNDNRYAELLVKVGARALTLQANGEGKMEAAKRQVIELAKAYVPKLR